MANKFYIQLNFPAPETVDECDAESEAHELRGEYAMGHPGGGYTVETEPTPCWED